MTERAESSIHVEDLIGASVHLASGEQVGRVVDLEVRPLDGWRVVSVVLGRFPFLDRFDTVRAVPYRLRGMGRQRVVAWSDVESVDDGRIVLRADAAIRDHDAAVPAAGGEAEEGTPEERTEDVG